MVMMMLMMMVSMMSVNTVADAVRPIHMSKSDLADVKAILSANIFLTNILKFDPEQINVFVFSFLTMAISDH